MRSSCSLSFRTINEYVLTDVNRLLEHSEFGVDSELYRYAKNLIENADEYFVTLQ
jgi:hypothetical protein